MNKSHRKQKPSCHPDKKHYAKGLCRGCYRSTPKALAVKRKWRKTSPKWAAIRKRYETKRTLTASWRNGKLKKDFGITQLQYEEKLKQQKGVCAICGKPPNKRRLAVDHNHTTKQVRALLCPPCNRHLGFFENSEWRTRAFCYLTYWNKQCQ